MGSRPDERRGEDGRSAPGDEWVALGVLTRPHGLRGDIRMRQYNPESRLLWERDRVWLRDPAGRVREVRIVGVRSTGGGRRDEGPVPAVLVRFEGAERREDAEALRGYELCVPRVELPQLEEDEFYVADLVGLRVRLEDGTVVGEVVDVLSYPSVSCLRVRLDDADLEVPMVEPWLQRVNPEAGEVIVARLEDVPRAEAGARRSGRGKQKG